MYDSALKVAVFFKLKTAYLKVVFVNIIKDKLKGVRDFCCCFILVFFFSYSCCKKQNDSPPLRPTIQIVLV
jgi:hypothetical protein